MDTTVTLRFVGTGRAAQALAAALPEPYRVVGFLGRGDDLFAAASGVDVLVLAVSDDAIAEVAGRIAPDPSCLVVHLSGSRGLDVLAGHPRRGAMHPLAPLPEPETGARRLRSGLTFAVAGDPGVLDLVDALGGRPVPVRDEQRAAYHAAASVAANHVVALLGHLEQIAAAADLPLEAFLPLTRAAVEDAATLGPAAALTGPASRGDWNTLDRHLEAIPEAERVAYRAGVAMVLSLMASPVPVDEDVAAPRDLPVS